jgi:hypothetical protein
MEAEPKGPINPDAGKPGMPMLYSRTNATSSVSPVPLTKDHIFPGKFGPID